MAGSQFIYNTDNMATLGGNLTTGSQQLLDAISQFETKVSQIQPDWDSPSGRRFQEAFAEWKINAMQMKENLAVMGQNAGTASQNISQADQSSTM